MKHQGTSQSKLNTVMMHHHGKTIQFPCSLFQFTVKKNIEFLCSELRRNSNLRTVVRSCIKHWSSYSNDSGHIKQMSSPANQTAPTLDSRTHIFEHWKCLRLQRNPQRRERNQGYAKHPRIPQQVPSLYSTTLNPPSIPHRLPRQHYHLPSNKSDR